MSDLAQLLELMHTSVRRWRTIRASGWESRDEELSRRAWERFLRPARSRSLAAYGAVEVMPAPEPVREPWRIWLAQPDRIRTEFMVGDESVTAVIVGDTWWSWSASRGVQTNRGDPHHSHGTGPADALIHPSSILPVVDFALQERGTFIGRPALEVLAVPSPLDDNDEEAEDWRFGIHGLGSGADDYRLVVDRQTGVLLRSEARLGGEPFRILETEAVAFDEELGEDVFAPPASERIEPIWTPRSLSREEIPDAVRFTVLVPQHPPFAMDHVELHPANLRHRVPEQLHITFSSRFFDEDGRDLWLVECAEPLQDRPSMEWREADSMRFGEDRESDPPLRIVRVTRAGTHVELRSFSLSLEEMLGLARSLVPFPECPPLLRPAHG